MSKFEKHELILFLIVVAVLVGALALGLWLGST